MSSKSDLATNMRATAEALVMAFDGKWTVEAALAPRAEHCVHTSLPASWGVEPKNNADWAARFAHVKDLFVEAKMTINDYFGSSEELRAMVRSTLDATTVVGPYHNEYVWILSFDESGEKITAITEFLDTKAVDDLRVRLAEAKIQDDRGH